MSRDAMLRAIPLLVEGVHVCPEQCLLALCTISEQTPMYRPAILAQKSLASVLVAHAVLCGDLVGRLLQSLNEQL